MTFDTHFRTMMGIKPVQAVRALYDMGVRVMGANCGNGPGEIERVIGEMVAVKPDDVYLIAQSNAGLPKYETATKQIHYDGTPEVLAEYALKMKATGDQLHRRVLRLDSGAHRGDAGRAERQIGVMERLENDRFRWKSVQMRHGSSAGAPPAPAAKMNTIHIPQTDSIEALARFWDEHDLTDFGDELQEEERPSSAAMKRR